MIKKTTPQDFPLGWLQCITLYISCVAYINYYSKFNAILGVWLAVAKSVAEDCCKI